MERKRAGIQGRYIGRAVLSLIILGLSFLLLFLADRLPEFAEWYAEHIYPVFTGTLGNIYGIFPFSVSEVCLYILICIITGSLIYLVVRLVRHKAGIKAVLLYISRLMLGASVLFLFYTLWCGINYKRIPFVKHEGILEADYTEEELKLLCMGLTEDVNRLNQLLIRDIQGQMWLDGTETKEAGLAMKALGKEFSVLEGSYPQTKPLINSSLLSMQQVSGIYSPFTLEANYNRDMTPYNIPFTACHELAHFKGFMEEEEANFIAYLACMKSDSIVFQYSGSLSAWCYGMNALYKEDNEAYKEVWGRLNEDSKRELKANNTFWKQYDGKVAQVANQVNDKYLKARGQADGVKSYGRMVDLMMAYQKRKI